MFRKVRSTSASALAADKLTRSSSQNLGASLPTMETRSP